MRKTIGVECKDIEKIKITGEAHSLSYQPTLDSKGVPLTAAANVPKMVKIGEDAW